MKRIAAASMLVLFAEVVTIAASDPLEQWNWRYPAPNRGCPLFSVAFIDGAFFACGADGLILRSPDGVNWVNQSAKARPNLLGIAKGVGVFVTAGSGNVPDKDGSRAAILGSFDGMNWVEQTPPDEFVLFDDVAYANELFGER